MHLSFAFQWVYPREPRGNGTVLVFLFSHGGGELFTSPDHGGIPTGFVRGSGTAKVKVLYLVRWSMCKNEQKACKEIGYICLLFLP